MSPTRRTFGALRVKPASTATTVVNTGAVVINCGRYNLVLEVLCGQSTRSNVCLTQNVGIVGSQKLTVSELVCSETRQRQVLYLRLMVRSHTQINQCAAGYSSSYCSSALCSSHVYTWLEYCRAWSVASNGWCCAGVGISSVRQRFDH